MDLRIRLKNIKTRNKADKQTIEDAIAFIDKVAAYGEKQKAVFDCLGYVPKENLIQAQAKIERLEAKCENTQIGCNFAEDEIKNLKKDKYKLQKALNQSEDYRVIAKAEAVKEFAERLKAVSHPYANTQMVFELQIDNLVKEMVGEG